jgi:high frequency lysogenization protein
MLKTLTHQVIALAGLSQALHLVQHIAKRGMADREDMEASIASILKIEADDVLDVYGGLHRVAAGLRQLERQLAEPGRVDPEQARYAAAMIFLERQLMKRPGLIEAIGSGVHRAAERAKALGVLDEEVLRILAETYQETLSPLKPQIQVVGKQRHLTYPDNANKIRALLLAGIRSAVLWRQCGGTRWNLLLHRTRLQREARRLLQSL